MRTVGGVQWVRAHPLCGKRADDRTAQRGERERVAREKRDADGEAGGLGERIGARVVGKDVALHRAAKGEEAKAGDGEEGERGAAKRPAHQPGETVESCLGDLAL